MLISFFRPAVKHVLGLGDPKLIPRGTAVVKCSHMSMENMNLQHPVVASVLNLFPVQFASCTFLEHSSVNKTIEFLKNKKKTCLLFFLRRFLNIQMSLLFKIRRNKQHSNWVYVVGPHLKVYFSFSIILTSSAPFSEICNTLNFLKNCSGYFLFLVFSINYSTLINCYLVIQFIKTTCHLP